MIIGITGTKKGATGLQLSALEYMINKLEAVSGHHGDCIGVDAQAHELMRKLDLYIVVHPPISPKARAFCEGDKILPVKDYLARNRDIVNVVDTLIGVPGTKIEQIRSGTWMTIRYARQRRVRTILIYPDGQVEESP
jgi:hypothetical protein